METNKKSYNKITEQWHENRNKTPVNKCVADFIFKPIGNNGYPIRQGFILHISEI